MRAAVSCFDDKLKKMQSRTLLESNIIAPERRPGPKGNSSSNPSVSGAMLVFWEVYIFFLAGSPEVFSRAGNVVLSDFVSGWVVEFVSLWVGSC